MCDVVDDVAGAVAGAWHCCSLCCSVDDIDASDSAGTNAVAIDVTVIVDVDVGVVGVVVIVIVIVAVDVLGEQLLVVPSCPSPFPTVPLLCLVISNLILLTKGDVVRNLSMAVNSFPCSMAAFSASRPCEHPGLMSASPGLGNNPRQSCGKSLFFSLLAGPRGSSSLPPAASSKITLWTPCFYYPHRVHRIPSISIPTILLKTSPTRRADPLFSRGTDFFSSPRRSEK